MTEMAVSESTVSVRGTKLFVRRAGAGAPMLYLHGTQGLGSWLPCFGTLARTFDVLAPDHPGFVASIVLCEIAWVLADCYGAERKQIKSAIEGLLVSKQIIVEEAELAWKALRAWDASQSDSATRGTQERAAKPGNLQRPL